jgi:transcription elongation GreA/GreB family factor
VGDVVKLRIPQGVEEIEVVAIDYPQNNGRDG